MQRAVSPLETPITQRGKFVRDSNLRHCSGSRSGPPTHTDTDTNTVMSHIRQAFPQTSTSSSRVSSVTRVEQNTSNGRVTGTLRLRAEDVPSVDQDASPARRIRWSEDVVDNEGMGKKSSKVCCIYHKARPVGESSSESESSDSDSSSSDSDQRTGDAGSKRNCHHHRHNHQDGAQESPERGRAGSGHSHDSRKTKRRKPSPNAYEKMPKNTKG
ncbi:hypothetical protein ASPCAL14503 [Aspergillus calidoustus]|uniref:Type 1 phosphatases regulator n=1 Tax=Aspergillus calidoustus TaxID=454130 RepID=A0A0U5CK34_ASPCI|nr:hypothetical protein ASPCAL14503 [Aspergillus calidoustus]